jgi:hypothetical protein
MGGEGCSESIAIVERTHYSDRASTYSANVSSMNMSSAGPSDAVDRLRWWCGVPLPIGMRLLSCMDPDCRRVCDGRSSPPLVLPIAGDAIFGIDPRLNGY